ncbi:MAG: conserved membrane protein of unknown function [Promethearchaeota archaeon]|nr:MAG: conserved membrane protein of unknown function [Candidatus Lokiarchaeota archaeon]
MSLFVFGVVFSLLFLAELGDKTQLIIFNITLEYEKPIKIALGGTLAFAILVSLAIFFGTIITQFIPVLLINLISGFLFLIIALLEIRDLKELYNQKIKKSVNFNNKEEKEEETKNSKDSDKKKRFTQIKNNPYFAGFSSIFIMELGDKSQILTITLSSIYPNIISVWFGAFLALSVLTWIGAFFGGLFVEKVSKFYLKIVTISLFIIIGLIMIITSFIPSI